MIVSSSYSFTSQSLLSEKFSKSTLDYFAASLFLNVSVRYTKHFSSIFVVIIFPENVQFVVQPTGLKIGKGRTARFDCVIKGGKDGKVLWVYGIYHRPGSKNGRVSVDRKDNSLVIQNVEASDMKNKVQCIADDGSNRKFSDEVTLQVIGIYCYYCCRHC